MINSEQTGYLSLLRANRNFSKIWWGTLLTNMADRMFLVILPIWLYSVSKSAQIVALGTAIEAIAIILCGFVGGIMIDRAQKKPLLIWMNLFVCIMLVPLIILDSSLIHPWIILGLVFALAFSARLLSITRTVIVNSVVGQQELMTALTMTGFTYSLALMLGPILASYGIVEGYKWVLLAIAVGYFCFTLLALRLHIDETAITEKKRRNILAEFRDGWQVCRQKNLLWGNILFMACFMMGGGIFASLFYLYTNLVMHAAASVYAFSITMQGIGNTVGGLFIKPLNKHFSVTIVTSVAIIVMVILELAYLVPHSAVILLIVAPFTGIAQQIAVITTGTLFQKHCPQAYLGRVMGFRQTIISLSSIIAASMSIALLSYINIQILLYGACVFLSLCALLGFLYIREEDPTLIEIKKEEVPIDKVSGA